MGYSIAQGQKAQLVDQNGVGILEETVVLTIADETIVSLVPFDATTIGLLAGNAGQTDVTLSLAGVAATHTVTVTAVVVTPPAPFDWALGDPVAA